MPSTTILRNLGLDALDVVNLRVGAVTGPTEGSIKEPLTVLAELKRQGLIRHLGLSNVTRNQLTEAQAITEIVCVQNLYNVAHRKDDSFIDHLAAKASPMCRSFRWEVSLRCSRRSWMKQRRHLRATPMQVALAWLLHRSPNILLIPGTSSLAHLRENLQAAALRLPAEINAELELIGRGAAQES